MKYLLSGALLLFVGLYFLFSHASSEEKKPQLPSKPQKSLQPKKGENIFVEVKESKPKKVETKKPTNRESVHYVEKKLNEENLKPLYQEWKEHNGVRYNVYSVAEDPEESFEENPAPPAVPTFVKANIGGDLVPLVVPSSGVHYLVTDNGQDLETTVLQSSNAMTPPSIH